MAGRVPAIPRAVRTREMPGTGPGMTAMEANPPSLPGRVAAARHPARTRAVNPRIP